MRTFTGFIRTDKVDSECEFEFEVEDDATPEQIEFEAREAVLNHIDWIYSEI